MAKKILKPVSRVKVKLFDKARFINTGERVYNGKPVEALLMEVNKESEYPYLVSWMSPSSYNWFDYWLTADEILEVIKKLPD